MPRACARAGGGSIATTARRSGFTAPGWRSGWRAHFAAHPGVIGWQIDNEVRPVPCHCDSCRRAFRAFLKQRYSTVEALNRAWGTWFWSQTYRDFEEVETPSADQLTVSTSQILEFQTVLFRIRRWGSSACRPPS